MKLTADKKHWKEWGLLLIFHKLPVLATDSADRDDVIDAIQIEITNWFMPVLVYA